MKAHTSSFKNQIKELGRQLDNIITYDGTTISQDNLFSISPVSNGDILKSCMKELDFETDIDIEIGTSINYQFGLLINTSYEYLDFGNYEIYSKEYNEDTQIYKYVCYDKMLKSMVDYDALQNGSFPMSVRSYLSNICIDLGITFANESDTFANNDRILQSDPYEGINYTYRDILDELAQVTASTICINEDDELEIRYITDTNDTIDEEYFKDINVKFKEKYGPINSIVLSRSANSDNVYKREENYEITTDTQFQEGVEYYKLENTEYVKLLEGTDYNIGDDISDFGQDVYNQTINDWNEIRISDNQIMNGSDRADYLDDIYNQLFGLEYYLNDYSSTGIMYYDLCDRYTCRVNNTDYSCILFNDEPKITQGLVEDIYTDAPDETKTDYNTSSKDDRALNRAELKVDKQNQTIEAIASRSEEINKKVVGEYVYQLTNDEYYLADKNYYHIVEGQYKIMEAGTDYDIGDPIEPNTIYEYIYIGGIESQVNSLSGQVSDNYNEIINKFNSYATLGQIESVTEQVIQIQTNTYTKTQIQQIADGTGVDGVKVSALISTEATFDKDGMHYEKTDGRTSTTINNVGLEIDKTGSGDLSLFAGYVEDDDDRFGNVYKGSSIVYTKNLVADGYTNVGVHGRFEKYTDPTDNVEGVGFFIV